MADLLVGDATVVTFGPRHPITDGAFRLRLHTDGATVQQAELELGYRHSGAEKAVEALHSVQAASALSRIDHANPIALQDVYARAIETLCAVEVPQRAQWLRVFLLELERVASHFGALCRAAEMAAMAEAVQPLADARVAALQALRRMTGSSLGHDVVRPGGLAVDVDVDDLGAFEAVFAALDATADAFITHVLDAPTFRTATKGVGQLHLVDASALAITGPALRAIGSTADLRSDQPYLAYDAMPFDVISAAGGDAYSRHAVRAFEIRESIRMLRHVVAHVPSGPVRVADHAMTPPPRTAFVDAPDLLAEHVQHYASGFAVPAGDVYVMGESPRGHLGCYAVSTGGARLQRLHLRSPSFFALQALPTALQGIDCDDVGAVVTSFDLAVGEAER